MMNVLTKITAALLALTLLATGCGQSANFRDGYWADRKDVSFVTAMEIGYYLFREKDGIACSVDFLDGWSGPGAPDDSTCVGDEVPFTAAGYLDILEPHEGVKPEDIYESAFIFYLIYHEETKQISVACGYMDESVDGVSGTIDPDKAANYIDYFYELYDDYVKKYGAPT